MSSDPLRVLVLTGGHKIDDASFEQMLDDLSADRGWLVLQARQPLGQAWLTPEAADRFDVVVLYDLPGLHLRLGDEPTPIAPTPHQVEDVVGLLDRGIGVVALHHALAGWPAWPGWADALGGRFHYREATLRGRTWPDSGYWHGTFAAEVVDPQHPVCAGVRQLQLTDELYCAPVFEDEVHPLLRVLDPPPVAAHASSFDAVLRRPQRRDWGHPEPSSLLGWTTVAGHSPVAVLLAGDGGSTFADADYRQLIGNAVDWAASPAAHEHASTHPRPVSTEVPDPEDT